MRRCILLCSVLMIAFASVRAESAALIGSVMGSPGAGMEDIPVEGACVYVSGTDLVTSTDSEGQFAFPVVPEGRYEVAVFHRSWEWATTIVEVYGDTVRTDIHTKRPLSQLQGSCWDPIVKFAGSVRDHTTGAGIPCARLMTGQHASGCGKYSTWTDGEGAYEWKLSVDPESVLVVAPGFSPLRIAVSAEPPDPGVKTHTVHFFLAPQGSELTGFAETAEDSQAATTLPDGRLLRNADVQLPIGPYGVVDATVLDSEEGHPVPRACLWVYELAQGVRMPPSGLYSIGPLPPGRYTIIAMAYDYWMKRVPFEVPQPMAGTNCSTIPITLAMHLQP